MCKFYSAIIMKNGDILHDENIKSHEGIIAMFNIRDNNPNCDNFVRVEFSPDNFDNLADIEKYKLYVDESICPDWFEDQRDYVTSRLKDIVDMRIIKNKEINLLTGGLYIVKNSKINILESVKIEALINSSVNIMRKNSSIFNMKDNSLINTMEDNSLIHTMEDNSSILNMEGKSSVLNMEGKSSVNYMKDNSSVNYMGDNSSVNYMGDNSSVIYMGDNSSVIYMGDNSSVNYMRDNSSVIYMKDNSSVKNDKRLK